MANAMVMLDCARCPALRMTHDVHLFASYRDELLKKFRHELFVQCRACNKTAIWEGTPIQGSEIQGILAKKVDVTDLFARLTLIRPKGSALSAPEFTPPNLKAIFDEAAECITIGAWNASSAMFRKILDHISKVRMIEATSGDPPAVAVPDKRTQFNLKPRLAWLFANNLLPQQVQALADCIREDANDGVHNDAIGQPEALDIQDFTVELLEVLYTIPGRVKAAEERRNARRGA